VTSERIEVGHRVRLSRGDESREGFVVVIDRWTGDARIAPPTADGGIDWDAEFTPCKLSDLTVVQ
jgi:hypothetical protein